MRSRASAGHPRRGRHAARLERRADAVGEPGHADLALAERPGVQPVVAIPAWTRATSSTSSSATSTLSRWLSRWTARIAGLGVPDR